MRLKLARDDPDLSAQRQDLPNTIFEAFVVEEMISSCTLRLICERCQLCSLYLSASRSKTSSGWLPRSRRPRRRAFRPETGHAGRFRPKQAENTAKGGPSSPPRRPPWIAPAVTKDLFPRVDLEIRGRLEQRTCRLIQLNIGEFVTRLSIARIVRSGLHDDANRRREPGFRHN